MPKQFTKEEIAGKGGKYDDDGFYILPDGGFFDPEGFLFDTEGFDAIGGKYDEEGKYVPPPGLKNSDGKTFVYDGTYREYADYYDELCGEYDDNDEEDSDEDQSGVNQDEYNIGVKKEHCLPVIEWLKEQPAGKKHVIKLANLPRQATE